jgi:hypothetical protein
MSKAQLTATYLGQYVGVYLQALLIFEADVSEQLPSRSDRFMHQERALGTLCL